MKLTLRKEGVGMMYDEEQQQHCGKQLDYSNASHA